MPSEVYWGKPLVSRGVPLQIVREVLGHASLSTASQYLKAERGD